MAQYESYYSNDNLDFEFEDKDYHVEVNAKGIHFFISRQEAIDY